jgi:hypothetical protein
MPFPNYSPIAQFKPFKIHLRLDSIHASFSDDCEWVTDKSEVIHLDEKRAFCRSGWFARRNQIRRESFLRRRCNPDLGGSQTVVSQPAAAPNFRVANSITYGHCGNNPLEPASVFNKLAKAGYRNSGLRIRASGSQSVNTRAFVRTHLAWFAKRRERADDSHRAFTTCAVSTWESEELDERPHALFLPPARKSFGSC